LNDERYPVNGDAWVIKEFEGDKALLVVIDGAGNGFTANKVANFVKDIIEQNYKSALTTIATRCHKAMRKKFDVSKVRNCVMSLLLLKPRSLEYLGVGDIYSSVMGVPQKIYLQNQRGAVGDIRLPELKARRHRCGRNMIIIMCSDGPKRPAHCRFHHGEISPPIWRRDRSCSEKEKVKTMGIVEREQEKALYEVKEFLTSVIANAPYGIMAFDLEGEIIMTNALAIEHLGKKMSVNSAVGENILELLKDIPLLTTTVETCIKKGREPFDIATVKIKKEFMSVKGRAISNGTILVIEDITDLKRTETELAKRTNELSDANIKLQELDHMKSMFIASMSHELRTPLNSIIGFTGLILQGISGKIDEEARKDLHIVYDSSKHLLNLINDVIDISKIESEKLDVYFEELKLEEILKEAVTMISSGAEEKGLEIKTDFPQGLSIVSDRRRLFQCVLNLMSNAVKFTEKGSIELKAVKKAGFLEISVRDTGIGIKNEDIPKLFTSFVRLDSPLMETTPGTGLGLYLTKKIMDTVFDGDISVESRYGRGSTFTLSIPLNKEA